MKKKIFSQNNDENSKNSEEINDINIEEEKDSSLKI